MQPAGRPMQLHVYLGRRREPVGIVRVARDAQRDIRSARHALAETTAAGLFSWRLESSCMLEFHYRSEADWVEFLRRPKTGAVVADQELLESSS